jgi:hypothetical protein
MLSKRIRVTGRCIKNYRLNGTLTNAKPAKERAFVPIHSILESFSETRDFNLSLFEMLSEAKNVDSTLSLGQWRIISIQPHHRQ